MDIQEIKQLIKIVEKSNIGELEIVEEGRKLRISKSSKLDHTVGAGMAMSGNPVYLQQPAMPAAAPAAGSPAAPAAEEAPSPD
ncbi:MAG TPA: acetyl-CoA carboxylase biotin carboxyl carrier protein, partial [Calditrichia bacterium]|nr:acetyl-CoA carboxylase biotin carboxyl carrier protein [Calditrichia bacterium]